MDGATTESDASPGMILIIDDEDYVADMIATVLRLEGFEVTIAYNGRDGLALAKTLMPQLIIVDIMMPYLNGLELVEQLRNAEGLMMPTIVISAGARPNQLLASMEFLAKPFDMERLVALIARWLPLDNH